MTEAAIRHNERTKIVKMLDRMRNPLPCDRSAIEAWSEGLEAAVCSILERDLKSEQRRQGRA